MQFRNTYAISVIHVSNYITKLQSAQTSVAPLRLLNGIDC